MDALKLVVNNKMTREEKIQDLANHLYENMGCSVTGFITGDGRGVLRTDHIIEIEKHLHSFERSENDLLSKRLMRFCVKVATALVKE